MKNVTRIVATGTGSLNLNYLNFYKYLPVTRTNYFSTVNIYQLVYFNKLISGGCRLFKDSVKKKNARSNAKTRTGTPCFEKTQRKSGKYVLSNSGTKSKAEKNLKGYDPWLIVYD